MFQGPWDPAQKGDGSKAIPLRACCVGFVVSMPSLIFGVTSCWLQRSMCGFAAIVLRVYENIFTVAGQLVQGRLVCHHAADD